MEVDLQGLCTHLQEAPAEQAFSFKGVLPYLLDHLLIPYMEDRDICCEDLDYNAFTMQDFVALEEHAAHIQKHREELAKLENRRTEILSWDSGREFAQLMAERTRLEESIDLGGLSPQEKMLMDSLGKELQQAESDYTAMKALLERPAPDLEKQKAGLEDLIRKEEDLISAALDYLSARNELTFQGLPLSKVAFSLYDVYKTTGEVKNAFRITYGGREYRWLSRSEKVFAGMEISELMKALTGRNYPVFVDDSESVVYFAGRPTGQVFLSRVAANTPLTVTPQDVREPELKKAG